MNKETFIDILMRDDPLEINAYIENKGKKVKPTLPYEVIDKELYERMFLEISKK